MRDISVPGPAVSATDLRRPSRVSGRERCDCADLGARGSGGILQGSGTESVSGVAKYVGDVSGV